MRWLILLLLLCGCASPEPKPIERKPGPVLYVTFECGHPEGAHVRPNEVDLDPDWPPVVCVGESQ